MNAKQRQLRLPDYLEHMLEASRLAQQYLAGVDKAEFLGNRMIQQAVMMNIVIVGETATHIRDEYPEFLSANPNPALPWHKMIGMRNRMAHGYFDTDLEIVCETVKTHLPVLEYFLATRVGHQQDANDASADKPSTPRLDV
ncbi:uncharacterized protein with HEPN domain [Paraburkholderia sp. GAS448]|uniref:HepT-like ribonuclease domain-containing protein n=1 Tax=Paraburkholderia sp. GAS448 TaxID=3035136 RepID=UPI003D1C6917